MYVYMYMYRDINSCKYHSIHAPLYSIEGSFTWCLKKILDLSHLTRLKHFRVLVFITDRLLVALRS